MDRFDEGQKVYLWWDEQTLRVCAGMDTQTPGRPRMARRDEEARA